MAKLPWKAWHEVVRLRDDLRSGDLPLHLFAADLYEVMMQNGTPPSDSGSEVPWGRHLCRLRLRSGRSRF